MQSWAEVLLAVVIHASALAYAHLGVTLTPQSPEPEASAERRVERSGAVVTRSRTCGDERALGACSATPDARQRP